MRKTHLLCALLIVVLCAMPCIGWAQQRLMTLDEVFSLAEQNSVAIDASRLALTEAEQAIVEAKTGRLPDIELKASASYLGNGTLTDRNFANATNIKMPHFGNNFAVEAAQLIYGGGVVSNAVAMAELKREMANINLDDTRSRVRLLLTGFMLDLHKMQSILEVYDRNIALQEELIADTKARSREGIALSNDVTRQELRLQQMLLQRKEVENTARILSSDLATTIGIDPTTEIIPDKASLDIALSATDESYWQSLAEEHNANLKRSELAVAMSERGEKLAKAERRPNIALIAANHFDGPITIEVPVIDKNFNYWYVGVGVSFKLSSLYKANRTIQRLATATERSRRELDDTRQRTSMAIHADYIRYEEAYFVEETNRKSVELAESNYRVVEQRYQNDIALITDMVDAANQLLDAELQLSISRINILMRYYQLMATVGIL
ncbi:MAG: TolC family protein [Alistipes sp.]|nr:TolC family protein [Alistipes sp.]